MLEINEGSGLDMFQEFMSECKVELNDNYDSFVLYNEKNKERDNKDNPTFMEFCLMEFITYSHKLFKSFINANLSPKEQRYIFNTEREELPN